MTQHFVEKQTSAVAVFFRVLFLMAAPLLALGLFGDRASAETCDALFVPTTVAHPTRVDHHVVEAVLNVPRSLRMNEISEFALRLFLANTSLFGRQKGFETYHDLVDLRVYKFRHGEAGVPFSHYQAEISFRQNEIEYEVDVQFFSNGSVAYLAPGVGGLAQDEETRAIATHGLGGYTTFQAPLIDAFLKR